MHVPAASRRSFVIGGIALAGSLGLTGAARAAADVPGARSLIEKLATDTVQVLKTTDVGGSARQDQLARLLREGFDLPYLSQLAVGAPWREANEAQRQRFTKVFSEWVVAVQSRRLGQYAGETFDVTGAQEASDTDSVIDTEIAGGKLTNPVSVQWRVRQRAGSPKIIDVVIAGVSMVVTYRNEFQPIVQQNGIDGLSAELERRAAAPS